MQNFVRGLLRLNFPGIVQWCLQFTMAALPLQGNMALIRLTIPLLARRWRFCGAGRRILPPSVASLLGVAWRVILCHFFVSSIWCIYGIYAVSCCCVPDMPSFPAVPYSLRCVLCRLFPAVSLEFNILRVEKVLKTLIQGFFFHTVGITWKI